MNDYQMNLGQNNIFTMLNSNWTMHNPTSSEPYPQKETKPQITIWNEATVKRWWCDKKPLL